MEKILEKWHRAKEAKEELEEKIARYKQEISKEMSRRNTDTISEGRYSVTRRRTTRTSLSKENVPESIWQQYHTRSTFDVFLLTNTSRK